MVAVIHASGSLNRALNYNEQKVKSGQATGLMAVNYPKDHDELTFHQKLNLLKKLAALNERTKVNSVHISLNFDPKEKLSADIFKKIAECYLNKIGFGQQPYLVYQHLDAGHPHLHIVTTNIKANGKRIELHNLGKNQSEKARKEIEVEFRLKKANHQKVQNQVKPVDVFKIQYGKSETKRSITNVLDAVLNTYKYSSIPELNAILKLYNVAADRGAENSRTCQKDGMLYRVLDDSGNKVGVPIKASLIYNKPTLKYLKQKFEINKATKQFHKERIRSAINKTLSVCKNASLQSLINQLKKDSVHVELRQNKEGFVYGITYLDLITKCVFNGSDLGKAYSVKGLQEQLTCSAQKCKDLKENLNSLTPGPFLPAKENEFLNLLDVIIEPISTNNYIPFQLKRAKKKKKKRLSI